ncbi:MAG: hypothetical protein ACOY4F_14305 [Thermodesulfobacteriota bacterium]
MSGRTGSAGRPMWVIVSIALMVICAAAMGVSRVATAEDYRQGTSYVEERGGVYGTTGDEAHRLSTQGGAAGYYVADGLALEAEGLGYSEDSETARTPDGTTIGQNGAMDAMGTGVMAKWHIVHGKKGSVHVGAGTGGIMSGQESVLARDRLSQANNADVGLTVNMSDSVSFKAQGRYQQIGGLAGGGTESMGGNVGFKISF